MALNPKYTTMPVRKLIEMYRSGSLELAPQFQRNSVWKGPDRAKLIDSIMRGMPLPSLFLYERKSGSRSTFDVIDGKQRLETIFAFVGLYPDLSDGPLELAIPKATAEDDRRVWSYESFTASEVKRFGAFRIQVVIVRAETLGEVVNLFVRLNSTGKKLVGMERRKAQFFESETLNRIQNHAVDFLETYRDLGVISDTDAQRMVHIELTAELLLSIERAGPLDKKKSLDQIIAGDEIPLARLRGCAAHLRAALTNLEGMWFGDGRKGSASLAQTRFNGKSDFYSLALFFALRHAEGYVMPALNRTIAAKLLEGFDAEIAEVADAQKRFKPIPHGTALAVQYLTTVKEGTDTRTHRQTRMKVLETILADNVLTPLSPKRQFDANQKRLLWYRSERECDCCYEPLEFKEFQADHILPWAKGGKTDVANGRVLCRECNQAKGNGRKCLH